MKLAIEILLSLALLASCLVAAYTADRAALQDDAAVPAAAPAAAASAAGADMALALALRHGNTNR
ncbi:MAG: hypothetical protein WAQ05_23945 [Rubrivivax sp.]